MPTLSNGVADPFRCGLMPSPSVHACFEEDRKPRIAELVVNRRIHVLFQKIVNIAHLSLSIWLMGHCVAKDSWPMALLHAVKVCRKMSECELDECNAGFVFVLRFMLPGSPAQITSGLQQAEPTHQDSETHGNC